MRIAFDLQGLQTESQFRGIGRYIESFLGEIQKYCNSNDIFFILNERIPLARVVRERLLNIVSERNIRYLRLPQAEAFQPRSEDSRRALLAALYNGFINALGVDLLVVTSPFEDVQGIVYPDGISPANYKRVVFIYDLIPLIFSNDYLADAEAKQAYLTRLKGVSRADQVLTISKASAKDIVRFCSELRGKVHNVSCGISTQFSSSADGNYRCSAEIERRLGSTPFVLYVGGWDTRKNLPRLIESVAQVANSVDINFSLVVAGKMEAPVQENLQRLCKQKGLGPERVVFLGYVTDQDLHSLYRQCSVFVFPSLYEGFGLPVLEAMQSGAVVVASHASSIPEILICEEALFDPNDTSEIVDKLIKALTDEQFRDYVKSTYESQIRQFNWERVAMRALKVWEDLASPPTEHIKYIQTSSALNTLVDELATLLIDEDSATKAAIANAIIRGQHELDSSQLLVDVTELARTGAATGIQRAVFQVVHSLMRNMPPHIRVEPVYALENGSYVYAWQFGAKILGGPHTEYLEPTVILRSGDCFLGLDLAHYDQIGKDGFYQDLIKAGVTVKFMVYDLLPIRYPHLFQHIPELPSAHKRLLEIITKTHGAICISQTVADDLHKWIDDEGLRVSDCFSISSVQLGADHKEKSTSRETGANRVEDLQELRSNITFLVVGTIEPRKQHRQVLDAFLLLWEKGLRIKLVFVGASGWVGEEQLSELRYLDKTHPHFFWFDAASDALLEDIYKGATCLIAASIDEGFGLPLIEAARNGLPILARDIPIFREICGRHAAFFSANNAIELSDHISAWLVRYKAKQHVESKGMPYVTWEVTCNQILESLQVGGVR